MQCNFKHLQGKGWDLKALRWFADIFDTSHSVRVAITRRFSGQSQSCAHLFNFLISYIHHRSTFAIS